MMILINTAYKITLYHDEKGFFGVITSERF